MSDGELTALYESLARYQSWRRHLRGGRAGEGLEMHKRLLAPPADGPAAGQAGLNEWLWARIDAPGAGRVLDPGCGFGATLLRWAALAPEGRFVGLTPSPTQVRVARREARRAGLDERCEFRRQGYDEPITGTFDVVVSVECLFHAPSLEATLGRLSDRLVSGGVLVLVEDMARDDTVGRLPAARELLARWRTPHLHPRPAFRRGLEEAGLRITDDVDLTGQVPHRSGPEREEARGRLVALRRWCPVPGVRRVLDAFLGGLALEELYAEERLEYRALFARRGEGAA